MNPDANRTLQAKLYSGESLLWADQPRQGLALRASDGYMIPFSLMWGGFAFFWEYSAFTSGAPPFFLLFGGVFVVIGVYMIVGRFFFDAWVRSATYYGLSDRRVLILKRRPTSSLRSLNLKGLVDVSLKERRSGRGSIVFGSTSPFSGFPGFHWPGLAETAPAFEDIGDAKRVHEAISNAQRRAT